MQISPALPRAAARPAASAQQTPRTREYLARKPGYRALTAITVITRTRPAWAQPGRPQQRRCRGAATPVWTLADRLIGQITWLVNVFRARRPAAPKPGTPRPGLSPHGFA